MNFLEQVINGLILGHIYALVALGWTMLLGVAKLINFAHGQMYMLGAFLTWWFVSVVGLPYPLSIIIAVVLGGFLGVVLQRIMLTATFENRLVAIMIMTLGFGYILEGGGAAAFGSVGQILETQFSEKDLEIFGTWVTHQDILIIGVTILIFIIVAKVLSGTRIGRMIRMVAEDPKLAMLSGIAVRRVYYGVFAFEGIAVAFAGGIIAPRTPIMTSMGFDELVITFAVVVLGGIGSIRNSYLAGILLGLFAALFGALVSPAYTTGAMFLLLIAILAVRPEGLGKASGVRV